MATYTGNSFTNSTNFGDRTSYGKELDKDINRYQDDLEESSKLQENIKTRIGEEQSAIIKRNNQEYKDNSDESRNKIDELNDNYTQSVTDRRAQADELVTRQKDAAGLEANIAAAKASQGGKMTVGQLTSINKDITNQFTTSINNAMKDNINFQESLDSKLANMGFSVIDKKRVLDEFNKVLSDEESAPLLDAIAEKYKTREGFMKALSDTIKTINQGQIKDSTSTMQRSERLERDENAFNAMTNEQKARDIRARFGPTWNVLTATQKQDIINATVSGEQSLRETLDMIKNLKDQATTNKAERQQIIASGNEELGQSVYEQSGIDPYNKFSTTTGDKNYTGGSTASKKNPESNTTKTIKPVTSTYKVGNVTYTSLKDYNMIKNKMPALKKLKKTDPVKFKQAIELLKEKYIIS